MLFLAAFAGLSLILLIRRPSWQRKGYIITGLALVLIAYSLGIDFNVFLYLYVAKSCFLLNRKSVFAIVIITAIISTPVYIEALPKILQGFSCQFVNHTSEIQKFTVNYLGNYLAGNTFAILFSSMVIAEQESRRRSELLAREVESLGVALERTRIARDIHDSLGHTLTNLQVQLAVAQEFRQHNLDQAFRAIDVAKLLTDQCIEDVSQSLYTMRQSNINFSHTLNSLIEHIKQNQSLQIRWEMNLPELPISMNHHLYCIVKEGLMNIQKHTQAALLGIW
jgi:signal transduction histidine kinase